MSLSTIIDSIKDHSEATSQQPMDVVAELFEFFADKDDLTAFEELERVLCVDEERVETAKLN